MEEGDSLNMGTESKNTPLFKEMSGMQCIHMCFFGIGICSVPRCLQQC